MKDATWLPRTVARTVTALHVGRTLSLFDWLVGELRGVPVRNANAAL